jgi:hypothetical protein
MRSLRTLLKTEHTFRNWNSVNVYFVSVISLKFETLKYWLQTVRRRRAVISICLASTNIFVPQQNNVSCFILSPFLVLSEHYPISFDQKQGQQPNLSTHLSALVRTINPPMPFSYLVSPISILSSNLLYTFFLFSSYRFPTEQFFHLTLQNFHLFQSHSLPNSVITSRESPSTLRALRTTTNFLYPYCAPSYT